MDSYDVKFTVNVRLDVEPEVLGLTQSEPWQKKYWEISQDQAIGLLAWQLGISEAPLASIPGFDVFGSGMAQAKNNGVMMASAEKLEETTKPDAAEAAKPSLVLVRGGNPKKNRG